MMGNTRTVGEGQVNVGKGVPSTTKAGGAKGGAWGKPDSKFLRGMGAATSKSLETGKDITPEVEGQ